MHQLLSFGALPDYTFHKFRLAQDVRDSIVFSLFGCTIDLLMAVSYHSGGLRFSVILAMSGIQASDT
jgi:hypothetical protein